MDPEPYFLNLSIIQSVDIWLTLSIVSLFLLLVFSALISGAEVAFFSLSRSKLNEAAVSNSSNQKMVVQLLENPKKLLATILISNNFINILIVLIFAYIGESVFSRITSDLIKFLIEVVLITFLILLFGEVLPKIYATRNSLKFATFMVLPIKIMNTLLSFISIPLLSLTTIIENKLGKKQSSLSVEKLSQALEITSNDGSSKDEQKILQGIVSFGNTETGQIMTPRIDVFALSSSESYDTIIDKIEAAPLGSSKKETFQKIADEEDIALSLVKDAF